MNIKLRCQVHNILIGAEVPRGTAGDAWVPTCPKCLEDARKQAYDDYMKDIKPPVKGNQGYRVLLGESLFCQCCGFKMCYDYISEGKAIKCPNRDCVSYGISFKRPTLPLIPIGG